MAAAAAIFVVGDKWESAPGALFLVWLGVHLAYGVLMPSFRSLPVALLVPLAVAPARGERGETALWVQALFAEAFYGIPFIFIGVVARRLWRARRRVELTASHAGEDTGG